MLADIEDLTAIDEQLARGIGRMAGEERPEVLRAVALASRAVRNGHVCLDVSGAPYLDALRTSGVVGGGADATPLVLDGEPGAERLYLRRYYRYETSLATHLAERIAPLAQELDGKALRASLDRLFPDRSGEQRMAALVAVARRFCIISGGPGTGKTTTVVKILALLAEQALLRGKPKLHVTLVAPTGKAAARLRESIEAQREKLDVDARIRDLVPVETSTIHRALGAVPGSSRFRHHADHPLPTDVLLVDEASMVDVALMSRLVEAVPPHARLILLGDRNQLASVEAGAILGDLCGPPRPAGFSGFSRGFVEHIAKLTGDELPAGGNGGLEDCVVQLRKNYRYPEGSGIALLAQAINDGDADAVLEVLQAGHEDVSWGGDLRKHVVAGYAPYLREKDPRASFEAFGRFRVLAAHRRGPQGVEKLNAMVAEALAEEGLLRPVGQHYAKRPVMVRENDYQVGLFNGDVGLVLPDPEDGDAMRAWFFGADGKARRLAPSRLPPHETVFAMTVHKAQGSEFDEVAVVLPGEGSAIVTRELLYTAVTRARGRVRVVGEVDVIERCAATALARASGLAQRLSGRAGVVQC